MIRELLEKKLDAWEDRAYAKDGFIRVTELQSICPRYVGIMRRSGKKEVGRTTPSERMMFDSGHAVHDTIRKWMQEEGALWGVWRCRLCGALSRFGNKPDDFQEACPVAGTGKHIPEYHESWVVDKGLMVRGRVDAFYRDPKHGIVVFDIKSKEPNAFRELSNPIGDHIFQLSVYWDLIHRGKLESKFPRGVKLAPIAMLFYVCQGFNFTGPFKQYVVNPAKDESLIAIRKLAQERALEIKNSHTGDLPRRICLKVADGQKRKCQAVEECFKTF